MDSTLNERAKNIRLLCLDVDGVLTDGRVYHSNNGDELKSFNIKDGFGIRAVQNTGITVALITGRQSRLVEKRAHELGITHIYQGNADKRGAFLDLLRKLNLSAEQCAHVGDDYPDLPLFSRVGLAVAVADAHEDVRHAAHWVTHAMGGHGAIREVCDALLRAQGHLHALRERYQHWDTP